MTNWVKSVRILSFYGPHFSAFGLNTERYQFEYGKIILNKDTFYAVINFAKK